MSLSFSLAPVKTGLLYVYTCVKLAVNFAYPAWGHKKDLIISLVANAKNHFVPVLVVLVVLSYLAGLIISFITGKMCFFQLQHQFWEMCSESVSYII